MTTPTERGETDSLHDRLIAHLLFDEGAADTLRDAVAATPGAEADLMLMRDELARYHAFAGQDAVSERLEAERRADALLDAVGQLQLAQAQWRARKAARAGGRTRWFALAGVVAAAALALAIVLPSGRGPGAPDARALERAHALARDLTPHLQGMGMAGPTAGPVARGYRDALVLWLVSPEIPAARREAARAIAQTLVMADEANLDALVAALRGGPCGPVTSSDRAPCQVGSDLFHVTRELPRAEGEAPGTRWTEVVRSEAAQRVLAFASEHLRGLETEVAEARELVTGARPPEGGVAPWRAIEAALLAW